MRLVDGYEADAEVRRPAVYLEKQTFGRDVQDFYAAAVELLQNGTVFVVGLHGIDCGGGDSVGDKSRDLVFHQGYER